MRRRSTWTTALLLTATLAGCGAKTGLRVPDVPIDTPTDVPPRQFCIDLDPDAGLISVDLETQPQLSVADVFFVIDRTGSMNDEIDNIKANLSSTIVPAIARTIDDVQFGVATYSDFAIPEYGSPEDVVFSLVSPVDESVANVQGAVNSIRTGLGGDNPEALTEALFQVASGEGYAPWIPPRAACPAPGRVGYGCLRPNAQPIFIVVTDAPTHNGPLGRNAYDPRTFASPPSCPPTLPNCRAARAPHTYDEMMTAVRSARARVIGISSGVAPFTGRSDLEAIARESGAVTSVGQPLVFDIGPDGRELDSRVVSAVETFTRQVRFNASARVVDLDSAHRATTLVRAIRPQRAVPMGQVERLDDTTFYGVVPGTRLTFAVDLQATVPRGPRPQRFPARVQFLADGRPNLGFEDIVIVIPAEDGSGCDGANMNDGGVAMDASGP